MKFIYMRSTGILKLFNYTRTILKKHPQLALVPALGLYRACVAGHSGVRFGFSYCVLLLLLPENYLLTTCLDDYE